MIFAGASIKNSCPNDKVFIKAFLQELGLEETENLIDHTLICKKCHLKFEALRQLSKELAERKGDIEERKLTTEEIKEIKGLAKKKFQGSKSTRLLFFNVIPARYMVAATVLLAVVVGLFFVSKINQREIYREGENQEGISLIKPSGIITIAPTVFSWTAYEGADDYGFELIDDDLNTIYEKSVVEINQLVLPYEISMKLKKEITYVWKVEAKDEFGKILSTTSTSFELK
jgi:hypothetical protein